MMTKIQTKEYRLIDHLIELYFLAHSTEVEKPVNDRNRVRFNEAVDTLELLGYEVIFTYLSSEPVKSMVYIKKGSRVLVDRYVRIETALALGYKEYEDVFEKEENIE